MFLLMTGDGVLAELLALFRDRDVPRMGWPTTILPPAGFRAEAIERISNVTVIVTHGRFHGTARLDLETRETVVSASGRSEQIRSRLRRLALAFVADRNDYDERLGLTARPAPPTFDEHDTSTWTSMQFLADVTDSDWYPPEPAERSASAWAAFYATAHRFNDRFTTPGDAATTPHPAPPRVGRSSADPAMPDLRGPAGG